MAEILLKMNVNYIYFWWNQGLFFPTFWVPQCMWQVTHRSWVPNMHPDLWVPYLPTHADYPNPCHFLFLRMYICTPEIFAGAVIRHCLQFRMKLDWFWMTMDSHGVFCSLHIHFFVLSIGIVTARCYGLRGLLSKDLSHHFYTKQTYLYHFGSAANMYS